MIEKLCTPENQIKKYKPVRSRLNAFGFQKQAENYVYRQSFCDGQFDAIIIVTKNNKIYADVIDQDTGEPYLPLRVQARTGAFVSTVRSAFDDILRDFYAACCNAVSSKGSRAWLIASNPANYSVRGAYRRDEIMIWHQNVQVQTGDSVFIYVTKPYSAILYRCIALETDIPRVGKRPAMALKFVREYPIEYAVDLTVMRKIGVGAVRGQRSMPDRLRDRIETLEVWLDKQNEKGKVR